MLPEAIRPLGIAPDCHPGPGRIGPVPFLRMSPVLAANRIVP